LCAIIRKLLWCLGGVRSIKNSLIAIVCENLNIQSLTEKAIMRVFASAGVLVDAILEFMVPWQWIMIDFTGETAGITG